MSYRFIRRSSEPAEQEILAGTKAADLIGKSVYARRDGSIVAARVDRLDGDGAPILKLAMPDSAGVLCVSDTEFSCGVDDLTQIDALTKDRLVKHFDVNILVEHDAKAAKPVVDDDKRIVDYLDVAFEGYASTFQSTTPKDRDGDYVKPGAFNSTLKEFKKNPVMLTDHYNEVACIAGSFEKIGIDERGLSVRGKISNSPVEHMVHKRFLVVEGHLKTLSIGGFFYYDEDGRGIEDVRLFEISLVAVPANPDAIFQVRGVTMEDAKAFMKRWTSRPGSHNLAA